MDGDFDAGATTFTSDDVDYTVNIASALKELNFASGKAQTTDEIPGFFNGEFVGWIDAYDFTRRPMAGVTIAATVSGKKLSGIYSVQYWYITRAEQATDAKLAQIEKNHKLLTQAFAEDDNGDIDMDSFQLFGVDSLDKIAEDNVVYVYTGYQSNNIRKIEVGTEVVTGVVSKGKITATDKTDNYAVIDGKQYNVAARAEFDLSILKAGNEVELYLDYNGDIFAASKVSSGNYAVVLERPSTTTAGGWNTSFASDYKMRVLSEEGVSITVVNQKKVDESDITVLAGPGACGDLIEYTITDDQMTAVDKLTATEINASTKITKKGIVGQNGPKLVDTSLIFSAPTDNDGNFVWTADDDEYSVLKKEDVLEKTISRAKYYANEDNEVEVIVIDSGATAESEYGVFFDSYDIDGGIGVDYYIDTTKNTDGELDANVAPVLGENLYKISQTTSGKVKYADAVEPVVVIGPATAVTDEKVTFAGGSFNLADNAIVYIWDGSELTTDAIPDDLIDETYTGDQIKLYSTVTDQDDDNYGCVDYIIVIDTGVEAAPVAPLQP
jgi:hypothetical protein